jgi:hypothetical protein
MEASRDLRAERLASLGLAGPGSGSPQDAVSLLGGIQAQDHGGAVWSIGLRARGRTSADVDAAIAGRRIVRTWAFRGTLHFLAPADVRWVTALLAPALIAANRRRYAQLELEERDFARCRSVIRAALAGTPGRTRAELARALEAGGLSARGQRAPYLLQRAALDGLICQRGLVRGEPLYVLLDEWVPERGTPGPAGDGALAELARRYLAGHGPASLHDFAWWSGLPVAQARKGLEAAAQSLERRDAGLWAAAAPAPGGVAVPALLLPPFDELLLGYRDRDLWIERRHVRSVNAGGGLLRPTVLIDGRVAGIWTRKVTARGLEVEARLFAVPRRAQVAAVEQAAGRLAAFLAATLQRVRTSPLATSQSRASRRA